MENSILYVILKEERGSSGIICQVIGIKSKNGEITTNESEIEMKVGGLAVFVPGNHKEEYEIKDILEIKCKQIHLPNEEGRFTLVEYLKLNGVTKAKFKYLVEILDINTDGNYIALDLIREGLGAEVLDYIDNEFYLSVHNIAYGPLRLTVDKKEIEPKSGKSIFKYKIDLDKSIEHPFQNDLSLLLTEPKEKIDEFDCSTPEQLLKWIKEQLKDDLNHIEYAEKLNKVIKLLNNQVFSGIENIRYERAKILIEKVELSFEQSERFKNHPAWESVLSKTLEVHREKFRKEIEAGFSERQKQILSELAAKNTKIEIKEKQLKTLVDETSIIKKEKDTLEEEIQYLINNRSEIVSNLKLSIELNNPDPHVVKKYFRLYEISESLSNEYVWYENFEDYFEDLIKFGIKESEESNFEKALKSLKTCKFIRSDNIYFVLNLINSIGHSKSYIQQVEGDWLKFEKWFQNGLSDIINDAVTHPETRFFFILQDFNLASPECYAKPVIDISNNVRKYIPGTSVKWPTNLWLVFVRLESQNDDFGFEINEDTFSNWNMLEESRLNKLHDIEMEKCFKL